MKKLLAILVVLAVVMGFGTSAMAGYDVQTAITSEDITGTIDFCEKYGAVTYTFSPGTVIYDGDWFYFDLPRGVELCQTFDFVVLGQNLPAGGAGVPNGATGTLQTVSIPDGTQAILGPWKVISQGAQLGNDGITVTPAAGASGMLLRVFGTAGSRRVNFYFYDDEDATLYGANNINGNTQLVVNSDTHLTLTLLDGEPWDGVATLKNPLGWTAALKDNDSVGGAGYGVYGEDANDTLQNVNSGNIWDNYICARITSTYVGGDLINVSFDSGGISGDDFITFQGQREIAHITGAQDISLTACEKRDLCGYVSLEGGQGANCVYQYDAPNEAGYCPDTGNQVFSSIINPGNRAIITMNTGLFGTATDEWYIQLDIVSGDGTYFAAAPVSVDGLIPTNNIDPCTVIPGITAVDYRQTPAWTPRTRSGVNFSAYPTGAGCGAVPANRQVTRLTSGIFTNLANINRILIDIPQLVYNPALLSDGDTATLRVSLYKVPCGLIFQADRCLANYVSTCAAAQPSTTLLFPYAVPLDSSSGYWFGMSFCNPSGNTGTATITVYEDDGDMGTYTTADVAPGHMVTMNGGDLLTNLTPDSGNAGTLGDTAAHIVVICNFGFAGGFGMMGDGQDSTGYTAYGTPGNAVGIWQY